MGFILISESYWILLLSDANILLVAFANQLQILET